MCNYSSLSFLLDKTFDVVIKGGEEWGVYEEDLWRKILGREKEVDILPREKERKERKVGARFSMSFLEF